MGGKDIQNSESEAWWLLQEKREAQIEAALRQETRSPLLCRVSVVQLMFAYQLISIDFNALANFNLDVGG